MIKLYIGSSLADFNETFNVMFSIGDIRNLSSGNNNKSYSLNLPLTRTNKRLLKHINQADVKSEPSDTARLYLGESLVMAGKPVVMSYSDYSLKLIISTDDWIETLKDRKLTDLDLSASDHLLTSANVSGSWSASYPVYRYPMINFGGLQTGETGLTAKWLPTDFIPMISIEQLIRKILEPYTISSTWLSTAFAKNLFILAKEQIANEDFIRNKELEVSVDANADNLATGSSSTTMMVTLNKTLEFKTETKDEGDDFSSNTTYTIPETGTYRFGLHVALVNTADGNASLTITDEQVQLSIAQNSTAVASYETAAYAGTELINGKTFDLDTYYIHCEAGDTITVQLLARCRVNILSGTQTVTISTGPATKLINIWGNANRYAGLNKNISLEEMLPDMTQADFLAAIRDIFNLHFWMDSMKRTIYIEPWDQFLSSTVVDLTAYIDYEEKPAELISRNYFKTIRLKWKEDNDDYAFKEYLKTNTIGPGSKDITLSSLFTKNGMDAREHPFSTVLTGYNKTLGEYTTLVPQIFASEPIYPFNMFDRKTGFNTRIVEWKGLTSGFSWNYNGTTETTYPKIQGLDFASIYTDYWMKLLHYVDKGKVYTYRMKVKPSMLMQFMTVVNTAQNEGFHVTYQIDKNYYFLQKITTDGQLAELELILKA